MILIFSFTQTEEELDEEPLEVLYTQEERGSIPLACLLSCLIGIGYLFPFSALTQPIDYWKMLFPDYNIEFSISAIYNYRFDTVAIEGGNREGGWDQNSVYDSCFVSLRFALCCSLSPSLSVLYCPFALSFCCIFLSI